MSEAIVLTEKTQAKYIAQFDAEDPFSGNRVTGMIHKTANTRYGMLDIETVNGKPCSQVIWATPKMHYPMDLEGNFKPPPYDKIDIYSKLDGTNILGFQYHDADGNDFISYKTRLMPFLKVSHSYGDFLNMWKEMLTRYPAIPELVKENDCNLSFELYGKRNKVWMEYDVSLDCALLFGVKDGNIIAPSYLATEGVPVADLIRTINRSMSIRDFEKAYQEITQYLNEHLHVDEQKVGNESVELLTGIEGSVWYLITDERTVQSKCKPDHIRDLHWAASAGIPTHSIAITIKNAFEQGAPVTYALIKEMLMEEYPESEVDRRSIKIENLLVKLIAEKELNDRLAKQYMENNFDIVNDKPTCMRWFGAHYDGKKHGSYIYNFLADNFGGEKPCADCGRMMMMSRMKEGMYCKQCYRVMKGYIDETTI